MKKKLLPPRDDIFWRLVLTREPKILLNNFTLKLKLASLKNRIKRGVITVEKAANDLYKTYQYYILIPSFIDDLKRLYEVISSESTSYSSGLYTVDEVKEMIAAGKLLALAGSQKALEQLPRGNWIGGTIVYFFDKGKGIKADDKIYVHDFTDLAVDFYVKVFDQNNLKTTFSVMAKNGFRFVIIPPFTEVHKQYSFFAFNNEEIMLTPTVGWVSGKDLNNNEEIPQVFDGFNLKKYQDKGLLIEIIIKDDRYANVDIVNIFETDKNSPVIEFLEDGFQTQECLINGKKRNLAQYIKQNNIDIRYPLIGDFNTANINISFMEVNDDDVKFYAPFFKGIKYHFAKRGFSYPQRFRIAIKHIDNQEFKFSANCILNYMYGEAERIPIDEKVQGPATFGEIAYLLVNQTFVYLNINKTH